MVLLGYPTLTSFFLKSFLKKLFLPKAYYIATFCGIATYPGSLLQNETQHLSFQAVWNTSESAILNCGGQRRVPFPRL